MEDRRWPWLVASVLLIGAGLTAAAATYLWWLPCRGAMLVGTLFEPADSEFSEECLVRMDSGTPFPLTTAVQPSDPLLFQLAVATVALAAAAWLVPVLTLRMNVAARCVGLAYGVVLVLLAVAGASPVGRDEEVGALGGFAMVAVDVMGLALLVLVLTGRWISSLRTVVRLVVLLWATTAFGEVRVMVDYAVMSIWSSANWDVPPGTGYLPAAVLLLAGAGLIVLTFLREAPDWGSRPARADRAAVEVRSA